MSKLEELREQWFSLAKEDAKKAKEFYWKELFPEVEKKFLAENKPEEEYDWLIITGGFAIEFPILTIKALKPKKVYFLGTKEFREGFLDKIVEKTGLKASDYIMDVVEYREMDVADVYQRIRERLDLFSDKKVILDLTRGKRIMGVGAGIVGAFFGFDLAYIDEEWPADLGMGVPGTEKLVTVRNPFDVFGDLEGREAKELFNHHNYGAAMFFYKRLREKVADPREMEIEELLAEVYLHWNSFNFKAALYKMDKILSKSKQYNIRLDPGIRGNENVLKILSLADIKNPEKLSDEFNLHIMVDLYANALRKAEVGMFEDAVSRLYRVIELISQYRLRDYKIESHRPDLTQLSEEYKKISEKIYGEEKLPPFEIGLKDGYILLYILKDYVVEDLSPKDLKDMFGVIRVRDKSIIAHGLELAGEKAFRNMSRLAEKFIKRICKKQNKEFKEVLDQHTFVRLKL